jgi:hypothetical protein
MDVETLFLGRIIERILVVVFGGVSLVLGWRLFIVGVVDPQIAEIKFKDWKVSLRQVGPGTVFAALGIAVMGIALFRPLEIGPGIGTGIGAGGKAEAGVAAAPVRPADARSVSYMGTPEDLRHWVRALNTVARLDPVRLQQDNATATAMKAELARAQQTVVGIRDLLLLEKFSQTDIATWQKYQSAYLQNPLSVPGEVRPTLSALEPWMTTTVADER